MPNCSYGSVGSGQLKMAHVQLWSDIPNCTRLKHHEDLQFVVCVRSFKTSKNDHIIEVQLYDDIDFICPYYPTESSASAASEFYTIYMVGIQLYTRCSACSYFIHRRLPYMRLVCASLNIFGTELG